MWCNVVMDLIKDEFPFVVFEPGDEYPGLLYYQGDGATIVMHINEFCIVVGKIIYYIKEYYNIDIIRYLYLYLPKEFYLPYQRDNTIDDILN